MVVHDIVFVAGTCMHESVCVTVITLNNWIQTFVKLKAQNPKSIERRSVYCRLAIITKIFQYFGQKNGIELDCYWQYRYKNKQYKLWMTLIKCICSVSDSSNVALIEQLESEK